MEPTQRDAGNPGNGRRDAAPNPGPNGEAGTGGQKPSNLDAAGAEDGARPADVASELPRDAPPDTVGDAGPSTTGGTPLVAVKGTWKGGCHAGATVQNGEIVPLKIGSGKLFIGANSAGTQRLPWDLDMVRIYERPPTLEMIDSHAKKVYEPCTAATGCLAEYDFEEAGGAFVDTGPNKLATTTRLREGGAAETVTGIKGKAARFGPMWLEIDHHAKMDGFARSFTIEAWMRKNYDTTKAAECPADGRDGNNPARPCEFMRLVDKGSPTFRADLHAGGLRFNVTAAPAGAGIGVMHAGDYNAFKSGEWFHYVVVFDVKVGFVAFANGKKLINCFP